MVNTNTNRVGKFEWSTWVHIQFIIT